ncbi:MAG: spermine/spermidine synthase domain-containing protein, partial [Desulfobacterales bacterium]
MKRRNERAITRVVIATGISSVVTQLLIIREFLAQFQGNEFIIALILFNWLILGGIGTILARWITRDLWGATANRLGWLSLILAMLPGVQILAIRFLRDVFFIHGSSVGFYPTLAYSFLIVSPYCLIVGFVLPYSLFVIRAENPDYPGARIYIIDNLGDVSGGALFSFALVFLVSPLKAVFLANLPLILATSLLFYTFSRFRVAVYLGVGLTLVILIACIFLEPISLLPREGNLVYYKESRYGRIEVQQDHEQYTLFVGGTPLFGSQNLSMAEETIHYPLAQLPRVHHVLLISAEGGMMTELEKYRPASVDYVELDPKVAEVGFRFGLIKRIPNMKVIYQDGRAYLANSNKIYDAIIVNLSEPDTFQINRFFTDRFFDLARRHLAPHGVLSFAMKGFENYLAEPQRQKLSSLYNTVKDYFTHVLLLPGQKIFFLCSSQPINTDIPALLDRKHISTRYIKGYYYGNLTHERIKRLNDLMDPKAPKNSDDYPQLMRLMFQQWFAKFSTSPIGFIAVLAVVCIVYLIRISSEEFALFSTGFTVMGSELLVIFAFQIFFGYIYLQIGLIVTVFLAGLLPGAWFGDRFRNRSKQTLALADGLLILLMGLLIVALKQGSYHLPVSFFLFYGFLVSLICGFQFPVALYLRGGEAPAVTQTFSADLIGAAFGTLMTNVVLIPYFGIIWAAAGLIGLKLLSLTV